MNYKILTAEEAASLIQNGDTLSFSGFTAAGTPRVVPTALAARAKEEHAEGRPFKVSVFTGASTSVALDGALAEAKAVDRRAPFQSTPEMRAAINRGEVNYFDMHLSMLSQYVQYGFLGEIDYCIIEAVEVTDDGHITLCGGVGNVAMFAAKAKHIIIELNSLFPKDILGLHDITTLAMPPHRREIAIYDPSDRIGQPTLQVDPAKIIGVVPCCYHYGVRPFVPVDETTARIGRNVVDFLVAELKADRIPAEFLPLQSGVGNIANAVLQALTDAPEIPPFKMYTEVLQDSVVDLIDAGKCTFASSSSLTLSDGYYDKVISNLDFYKHHIVLRPCELSNNPEVIRRLGVITMNTALEVDLFGNVNSTHVLGTKMMNGVGGSADFTRNAYISIFTCPSTAKGGLISAIVPFASHVDNSEHSVMIIATEQGVADLRGKSPRQRAECIIENCAHPSYRPLLREYLKLMPEDAAHTPQSLHCALAFHEEFMKSGDMHNVDWAQYQR
jgi:succinate CoA transferase